MGSRSSIAGEKNRSLSKSCGYQYMTPSYVLDEELDEAASYSVVANALLENSSAHGLPTLYRAQGNKPHSAIIKYFVCISFVNFSPGLGSAISCRTWRSSPSEVPGTVKNSVRTLCALAFFTHRTLFTINMAAVNADTDTTISVSFCPYDLHCQIHHWEASHLPVYRLLP